MEEKAEGRFYTYTLAYPDEYPEKSGQVFYVGKGSGNRIFQHERAAKWNIKNGRSQNPHKERVILKIFERGLQVKKQKVAFFNTAEEAYEQEKLLIQYYGLKNLTNLTLGGDGTRVPMEELDRNVLNEARCILGWTVNNLADAANISSISIFRMLRGEPIQPHVIWKVSSVLSEKLGVSIDLVKGTGLDVYYSLQKMNVERSRLEREKTEEKVRVQERRLATLAGVNWSEIDEITCQQVIDLVRRCKMRSEMTCVSRQIDDLSIKITSIAIVPSRSGQAKEES